ncbi:MAG TPA: pyridoxal phosphate-dependent aminotransferase [Ignavibacteria bacterium]|nr:pyridoxal phosphate-dependent aminotransferase [Ignavibacteria bacterium]
MSIANTASEELTLMVCRMAETLQGSSILKIANEIKDKKKQGFEIYNLTIGDFDSKIYPIPAELEEEIAKSYKDRNTTYPNPQGNPEYREAVADYIKKYEVLDYSPAEFLITGGARALVYSIYRTILDAGDGVIYPVPSWNNNHYTHLADAKGIVIETKAENNFMPTAEEIAPHIGEANLISLCSPQNPTGTVFTKEGMEEICNLVLEENEKRAGKRKPVYIMLDQIYWMMTYGEYKHYNPVSINPAMRNYTVFVDGMSKVFCATGLRAGWGFGPLNLINKMKSIISHIGAFTATAEQVGITNYLRREDCVESHIQSVRERIYASLSGFYEGFMSLKNDGYPVDAIQPQAAMYLTVKLDLLGKKDANGKTMNNSDDITLFLIDEAKIGLIPFTAFGSENNPSWFRLSVGTCTADEVPAIMSNLKNALDKLS